MHPKYVGEAIEKQQQQQKGSSSNRVLPEGVNSNLDKSWLNSLIFGDFKCSNNQYKKKQKQTLLLWLLLLLLLLLLSNKKCVFGRNSDFYSKTIAFNTIYITEFMKEYLKNHLFEAENAKFDLFDQLLLLRLLLQKQTQQERQKKVCFCQFHVSTTLGQQLEYEVAKFAQKGAFLKQLFTHLNELKSKPT